MAYKDPAFVNLFFSLLRSGLYGMALTDAELPESIDWEGVVALAQKHGVLGTIIESVELLPERLRPTGPMMAKMGRFALGLIHANLILDKTVARLVMFLRGHGIEGVLLKGQGVARYYRKPQMRQSGDIDFYVGNKMYRKAMILCKENLNEDDRASHETSMHYVFYMDGVEIELHRLATGEYSRKRNRSFDEWIADEVEHSLDRRMLKLGNTDVSLPSYDFDALYIFYHAWGHLVTGGIGLRQLCDWAMIFHHHSGDIGTARLKENIRRYGLTRGWKLFAYIAVKYLGVEENKIPMYDPRNAKKYDKVMEYIVSSGNFGYHSEAWYRMKAKGNGVRNRFGKLRSITEYFITLLPIAPIEATSIYFNRLFTGFRSSVKRSLHRCGNKLHK